MKLLYLPNEPVLGWQAGARSALQHLREVGILSDLAIYSFLQKPPAQSLGEILNMARQVEPDVILFTKIDKFPISQKWLEEIKALNSRPLIAYYDGDIYGRLFKRCTQQMKLMCRYADLIFLCGFGHNAKLFERSGGKAIFYSPHSVNLDQFRAPWIPTAERDFDVILIGNRIKSRIGLLNNFPCGRMPGAFERERLVRTLGSLFGQKFAVFGRGWEGFQGNQGSVPFERQHDVIRQSWLSVGYDHFPGTPYYFSDRLPIALLSGIAHVVHYHPGYEALFQNGRDLLWADSVDGVIDAVRTALSRGDDYLNRLGASGREYVTKHLTSEVVYGDMIRTIKKARHNMSLVYRY